MVISQLEWWIFYVYIAIYPKRFPKLRICGLSLNRSLIRCSYLQYTVPRPHAHNKCKNKQTHTSDKPSATPFDKCWALYFSHQKWNITLSHSLKSTKANYPSFTQVPMGQESPIYLGPDVSMSQSGDSRPQRRLLTSLRVVRFQGASDSAGWSWCHFTAWLLM